MPSAAVDAAFKAKLTSDWNTTLYPVLGLNGVTEPPVGVNAFVVVQYPVANADKPVLGRHYFEDGAARFVLNVKSGLDLATVLPWADTIAGLFRNQKFGGIETFVPEPPAINDANDDGNWFELSVIVPYRYQFNG